MRYLILELLLVITILVSGGCDTVKKYVKFESASASVIAVEAESVHIDAMLAGRVVVDTSISVKSDICYGEIDGVHALLDFSQVPVLGDFFPELVIEDGDVEGCKGRGVKARGRQTFDKVVKLDRMIPASMSSRMLIFFLPLW